MLIVHEQPPPPLTEAMIERALARLREVLAKKALRMTHVREAIVRAALSREGHFEVQTLAGDLRDKGIHEASVATVYRTIPLMVEAGIVKQTMLSSGESHRYEASFEREHHDHLVCESCGKVIEFHFEAFEMLQRDLAAKYDFELTAHVHELIGLCGDCRRTHRA